MTVFRFAAGMTFIYAGVLAVIAVLVTQEPLLLILQILFGLIGCIIMWPELKEMFSKNRTRR